MGLKVIGAGLGRTGTMSLKIALEKLLGGPCYHMTELFGRLEAHTPLWRAAARGEAVDWDKVFDGYVAAVDEPASTQWQSITRFYPDALVILSLRDPEKWWKSASDTIFQVTGQSREGLSPVRLAWLDMIDEIYKTLYPMGNTNAESAKAAFKAHIDRVKSVIPAARLLVWDVSEGWDPICAALGLPVPDEPFPATNSTAEFKARPRKSI
jgi:hypothetical protein